MLSLFEKQLDGLIGLVDQGLRTVTQQSTQQDAYAGQEHVEILSERENQQSGALMRVNHVGEVCAQALYLGQAITARSDASRQHLLRAAAEEQKHLGWCEQRLAELGDHTSKLNPAFFAASALIGIVTGMLGDRISLGFVEATEDQVVEHLDRHLAQLPASDERSKEILQAIRSDELHHGESAIEAGGTQYPATIRQFMTVASKVMTTTTKYI